MVTCHLFQAAPIRYNVWLDIANLPLYAWSLDQITHIVASAGLILHHQPLYGAKTFDSLKLLLATTSLNLIPKTASLTIRGLTHILPIKVLAWIEEFPFSISAYTTLLESVYEDVAQDVYANLQITNNLPSSSTDSAQSGSPTYDPVDLLPKGATFSFEIDRDVPMSLIKDAPTGPVKEYLYILFVEAPAKANSSVAPQTENSNGGMGTSSSAQTGDQGLLQSNGKESSMPTVTRYNIARPQLDPAPCEIAHRTPCETAGPAVPLTQ